MRLFVVVEGQTEEAFTKNLLVPHLASRGVYAVPIIVTTRRDPKTGKKLDKGGGHWVHWRADLRKLLREQPLDDVRVTTLFDLYGLPDDFPELAQHRPVGDTNVRVQSLEQAMRRAVDDDTRLIPYLQRHEFEALVLASLNQLGKILGDIAGLAALGQQLGGLPPEDVNDGTETAPSKRLLALRGYNKVVHGPSALMEAGLAAIRERCPRFHAWVTALEELGHGYPSR